MQNLLLFWCFDFDLANTNKTTTLFQPACGKLIWYNPESGEDETAADETVVVVAGGHDENNSLSSTELLFFNNETLQWVSGTNK